MEGTPQEVFLDVAQPVSVVLNEQFTPSEHENAQGYFVQQQQQKNFREEESLLFGQ